MSRIGESGRSPEARLSATIPWVRAAERSFSDCFDRAAFLPAASGEALRQRCQLRSGYVADQHVLQPAGGPTPGGEAALLLAPRRRIAAPLRVEDEEVHQVSGLA